MIANNTSHKTTTNTITGVNDNTVTKEEIEAKKKFY